VYRYPADTNMMIQHFIEKPDTWIRFNIFKNKLKLILFHNRKLYVAAVFIVIKEERKKKRREEVKREKE
jgi:hypothetical protein